MSHQNRRTVEVYQKKAKQYLSSLGKVDVVTLEKADASLHQFISRSLEFIPKGGKVLEVGSANGNLSLYIKKLGYIITPSDVADDFLNEIAKKGLKSVKFNLLEDKFRQKYHCIICWKVFVHFTEKDIFDAMTKICQSLEENGILIFNLISDETRNIKEEWVDFPGEYSIGADRYFRYYSKREVDDIIKKTGFQILNYHKEIGIEKAKWLIYVLRKGQNEHQA